MNLWNISIPSEVQVLFDMRRHSPRKGRNKLVTTIQNKTAAKTNDIL